MSNEKVNGKKASFFERRTNGEAEELVPANENTEQSPPDVLEKQNAPAQEQAARIASQIIITLYEDGNAQVTGPFQDRIRFHGLLAIAGDIEREIYNNARNAHSARQAALAGEPFWKRKLRERAARKAAEKEQQAQNVAAAVAAEAVGQQDELTKALEQNAKKPS